MEKEKFVVTPGLFDQPEGFQIVCKSQEEVDACLQELHNMGLLWHDGSLLTTPAQVIFDKHDGTGYGSVEEFARLLLREIMDDNDKETIAIAIGCVSKHIQKKTMPLHTVGYGRVSDWKDESTWLLRVPRKLFKNCIFSAAGREAAKEVSYDDEN